MSDAPPPQVHTLTVNGLRYSVRVGGRGPALLLLHGFAGSGADWDDVRAACEADATVIAPDLIGHGDTDLPLDLARAAMPAAAADLVALLGALGHSQAALVGYSMGGRLALYAGVHHPGVFTTLVLESASPGLAVPAERAARAAADDDLAAAILARGTAWFAEYWAALPLFASQAALPADVRARQQATRLRQRPVGLADSLRAMGSGVQPSLWGALGQLHQPTLLLTGAHDAGFQAIASRMAAHLPQTHHVVVAGAGHNIHLEQQGAFVAALKRALPR